LNLLFRQMDLKDLEDVKSIDKIAFPNPWPENAFRYEIEKNPNARLWVVEVNEEEETKIIGFSVIWIVLDEAHVGTIAIHPNYQNQQFGQKLLANVCKQLITENISKIFLEVRESNNPAIHLYESFGFDVDGERKKYYRDNGETAILMSAPIHDIEFYESILQNNPISNEICNKEILR